MASIAQFDVVFIGSGPGGYVGAIRAAQLGLKTAMIEKDPTFGGTCLNVGCIPSKALLESSEHYYDIQHEMVHHGIKVSGVELDLKAMMSRKDKIVKDLTQGISFLFKKNKIESFKGFGRIIKPGEVEVKSSDGKVQTIQAKNIVISTGSIPVELPFLKFDEKNILSSTGALSLDTVPKSMVVVGGGVIGLELGSVWQRLGSKVTIVEFADKICGSMDSDCLSTLQKYLSKQGMTFMLSTKVIGSKVVAGQVVLDYELLKDGTKGRLQAEKVLVATGRRPFTEGLGCEQIGIEKDAQGRIVVGKNYQTSIKNIYAIGDVIVGPMLAHKAEEEGVAVAEIIGTHHGHVNYQTCPSVIYTHPEIAAVGLTEVQAKNEGYEINVGKFPFMANGRAKALGFTEGFVKIIADKKTDRIIGAHIVGPRASEILSEIIISMEFGGSSEDLGRCFHSHPTLSEVIREAALNVEKRARQM